MPADFLQKLCKAEDKVNPEDLPSKNIFQRKGEINYFKHTKDGILKVVLQVEEK